ACAEEIGARMLAIGRDFRAVPQERGWRFEGPSGSHRDALPVAAFGGDVQAANMAACVALVDALRDVVPVSEEALRAGLANARLRGRIERQVRDGVEWVFDVAHNPSAARVLRQALEAQPASRTL